MRPPASTAAQLLERAARPRSAPTAAASSAASAGGTGTAAPISGSTMSLNLAGCAVATSTQRSARRSGGEAARRRPRRSRCAGTTSGRARGSRGGSWRGSRRRRRPPRVTLPRSCSTVREQPAQALHVARVADVHRRGQRRARSAAAATRRSAGTPAPCDWHCSPARSRRSAVRISRAQMQASALPRLPVGMMKFGARPSRRASSRLAAA